ncbi:MAG TPA: hypothetical protein VFU69_17435 [Ktedonobacterales bacterium]|nr:hypothetical protein [Ktedonobacterales bacterium]
MPPPIDPAYWLRLLATLDQYKASGAQDRAAAEASRALLETLEAQFAEDEARLAAYEVEARRRREELEQLRVLLLKRKAELDQYLALLGDFQAGLDRMAEQARHLQRND